MKLLAVDIGNTDAKFGTFQDGLLMRRWRFSGTQADPERFAAKLGESLRENLLYDKQQGGADCSALAYACVIPRLEPAFLEVVRQCLSLSEERIFSVGSYPGDWPVDFTPYPLDQLGADRLVNVCAARLLYPGRPVAVMDFGTATTLDLLDGNGRYMGGAITPGLKVFTESLSRNTARLFPVDLAEHPPETFALGFETKACLEAGLGLGYRGVVGSLLDAALAVFPSGEPPLCIATGGLAEPVIRLCGPEQRFAVTDPALTLKGLDGLYRGAFGHICGVS